MTDFTTPTGKPILLGNSVTEATFVQTACMTCHSRATLSVSGVSPYPNVAGFTPDDQSYNGTPRPEWYYADLDPSTTWSLQTDFVWAILVQGLLGPGQRGLLQVGLPGLHRLHQRQLAQRALPRIGRGGGWRFGRLRIRSAARTRNL